MALHIENKELLSSVRDKLNSNFQQVDSLSLEVQRVSDEIDDIEVAVDSAIQAAEIAASTAESAAQDAAQAANVAEAAVAGLPITLSAYGAGEGGNDAPLILQALVDANGGEVKGVAGATYRFESTLEYTGSVKLDLSMSKVYIPTNVRAMLFSAEVSDLYPLASDYDLATPLELNVSGIDSRWLSPGQIVHISSRAKDPGNRDKGSNSSQYRCAELFRLGFGSTPTKLILQAPLYMTRGISPDYIPGNEPEVFSYTVGLGTRIVFVNMDHRAEVKQPAEISYEEGHDVDLWNTTYMTFRAFANGKSVGGKMVRGYGGGISLSGTNGFEVLGWDVSNLSNNSSQGVLGYGVADAGYNTRVIDLKSHNVRHGYTTTKANTSYTLASLSPYGPLAWGRAKGAVVSGSASGGTAGLLDTHACADSIQFVNCISSNSQAQGFSVRGRNIVLANPIVRNTGRGVYVFTEYNSGDPNDDFYNNGKSIDDFTSCHILNPNVDVSRLPLVVSTASAYIGGSGLFKTSDTRFLYCTGGGQIVFSGYQKVILTGTTPNDPEVFSQLIRINTPNTYSTPAFGDGKTFVEITGVLDVDARGMGSPITGMLAEVGTKIIISGTLRMRLPAGSNLFSANRIECVGNGRIEYSIEGQPNINTASYFNDMPVNVLYIPTGERYDRTDHTLVFNTRRTAEAVSGGFNVNYTGGTDNGLRLRNESTAVGSGNNLGGISYITNDLSNPEMTAAKTLYRGRGALGFVDTVLQRTNNPGVLYDAFRIAATGDVTVFKNDGVTPAMTVYSDTGSIVLGLPGPYEDDATAAAVSRPVEIGQAYYKPDGTVVCRVT